MDEKHPHKYAKYARLLLYVDLSLPTGHAAGTDEMEHALLYTFPLERPSG